MPARGRGESFNLYLPEGTEFPAEGGRRVRFTAAEAVPAVVALRNHTRYADRGDELDPFNEPATDVLAADVTIPDADGRRWQTTAYFSTSLLVDKMLSPGESLGAPFAATRTPDAGRRDGYPLRDLLYFNDDHLHRLFVARSGDDEEAPPRVARLAFTHLLLRFDARLTRALDLEEADGEPDGELYLRARLHAECAFDRDTEEDLGPLVFQFRLDDVFFAGRLAPAGDGWEIPSLPVPPTFRPAPGRGKRVPHVRVE